MVALRNFLSLRKPPLRDAACGGSSGQGGCLEGRTALVSGASKGVIWRFMRTPLKTVGGEKSAPAGKLIFLDFLAVA
jgi:hypothetical protein